MSLAFILVLTWLVNAPTAGADWRQQDPTSASPSQSPAPADPVQAAPAKAEPPVAEQSASDRTAKKPAEGASGNRTVKRRGVRKGVPQPAPAGEPRKIVVREGGATEPPAQIVPGIAPQQASQQRQKAVELLGSAEENLKQLAGRSLGLEQQETVAQIHNYVDGARSALKDGDTQRAHTLALKAYLLADDLVKH